MALRCAYSFLREALLVLRFALTGDHPDLNERND